MGPQVSEKGSSVKADRLFRLWHKAGNRLGRRLVALAERCAEEGTARQIHDLRVILRRFRFWVRVGRPLLAARYRDRLDRWGRRVAERTGRVRDIDASAEWLRKRRADSAVVERFRHERLAEWRRQQRGFRPLDPKLVEGLLQVEPSPEHGRRLRRRVRKLEQCFEDDLAELLPRFFKLDPARQHEARKVVRRWRYLREMLGDRKAAAADRLLEGLLAVQSSVGDQQNLQLGLQLLKEIVPPGASRQRLIQRGEQAAIRQRRLIQDAIRQLLKELE